ncbi:MAG: hypothetical protein CVU56_24780 [Deltaproteobacteria bacterium HGW-Deltaproteobacteria-14]|jgi:uncharacterized protein (DUF1501 family)|nr:MAG: hypothetical protein CVU56_24780 [Deltaproteobacteria bacterium HGW-Deltaproteobacteria-14]
MGGEGISRRGILRGGAALALGGAALGGAGTLSRLARAAATPTDGVPDRYYIFCYFGGGWDILMSLDPRDPAVFTNGNIATTRIQPNYEQVSAIPVATPYQDVLGDGSMFLGPFMGELAAQADRLCVVRGLSMDTVTHEVGRRRFLTGKPPSGLTARGSSTDTWFASQLGAAAPVPNLSIRVESYNTGDLPNYATALRTNGIDDLLRVLKPAGPTLGSLEERQLDLLLAHTAACPEAERSALWRSSETSRSKAQEMVTQGLSSLFDFRASTPEMLALRDLYGIDGTSATALRSSAAMAAMAATAIMSGTSRAVSVQIVSRSLDTHFTNWATDQGPTQAEAFTAIARMMNHLDATPHPDGSGDSWLDRTVVVGFSEFSRTPLMNATGGRDHALVNCCLLAGGNIAGGKVVGASSNIGMNPLPVDLGTGAACALDAQLAVGCPEEPGVEVIRPEHVLQALYHEIGMTDDPADLRVAPLDAIFRG